MIPSGGENPTTQINPNREGIPGNPNSASPEESRVSHLAEERIVQGASSSSTTSTISRRIRSNANLSFEAKAMHGLSIALQGTDECIPQQIASWKATFGNGVLENRISHLSKPDQLYLCCLLQKAIDNKAITDKKIFIDLQQQLSENYKNVFQATDLQAAKESLDQNPDLSHEEKSAALASFILYRKLEIPDILEVISKDELLQMGPHLRFIDSGFSTNDAFLSQLINNSPNLTHLTLLNSNIEELPAALPYCQELVCAECRELKALPSAPFCQVLVCSKCPKLQALPADLSLCQGVDCSKCPLLSTLPSLPACLALNCSKCPKLRALPAALPVCEKIDCSNCAELTALPAELPLCRQLNCSDCPLLQALPAGLPACENLDCSDCPLLRDIPEVPSNAEVYSSGTAYGELGKWDVDHTLLKSDPKGLLLHLGNNYLLKGKPFPNINYKESIGIDAGGLRRFFVSRLCENILAPKGVANKLSTNDGYPMIDKEDKNSVTCYRTLGGLMALCFLDVAQFKAGPFMGHPEVYHWIADLPDPRTPTDEWYLSAYVDYMKGNIKIDPQLILDLADSNKPLPKIPEETLISFSYLVDPSGDTEVDAEFFNTPENRLLLRNALLEDAKGNDVLLAVRHIASAMKARITENGWRELCAEGGGALRARIEGELTSDLVLEKLEWSDRNVPPNDSKKTKEYLEAWITEADDTKLSNFVLAVSSLKSIGSKNLKMLLRPDKTKDHLPEAHTCFFRLDIPSKYPSKEHFNAKLERFLKESLEGSGFEMQ